MGSAARALAICCLLALTGCTGSPVREDLPDADDIEVSLVQYRRDTLIGNIQVKTENLSDHTIQVTGVTLDASGFQPGETVVKDSTIRPGFRVDLTIPLPDPVCDGGSTPSPGPASVTFDASFEDAETDVGAVIHEEVDAELLRSLHTTGCQVAAVREAVSLDFASEWRLTEEAGELVAEGTLQAEVSGDADGPVTLERPTATTLFTIEDSDLPVTIDPGQRADITIQAGVMRCDPHAVAESKKGFVFPLYVVLPGSEAVYIGTTVPEADRGPLNELIQETCDF